jgi:hypothetical protein
VSAHDRTGAKKNIAMAGLRRRAMCAGRFYPHEIIKTEGTLGLVVCSFTNNEASVMMRKRISFRSELPLERHWLSKVRRVMRQARNSRERAEMWGNELTRYLSRV